MTQKQYDAHVETLKSGKIVVIEGRSAVSEEELRQIIQYGGDTLPASVAQEDQKSDKDAGDDVQPKGRSARTGEDGKPAPSAQGGTAPTDGGLPEDKAKEADTGGAGTAAAQ